jgi:hypothetical protein
MSKYIKPAISDQEIDELVKRNQERLQKAIANLGDRWLLHPSNKVTRKDDPNSRNAEFSPPRCLIV